MNKNLNNLRGTAKFSVAELKQSQQEGNTEVTFSKVSPEKMVQEMQSLIQKGNTEGALKVLTDPIDMQNTATFSKESAEKSFSEFSTKLDKALSSLGSEEISATFSKEVGIMKENNRIVSDMATKMDALFSKLASKTGEDSEKYEKSRKKTKKFSNTEDTDTDDDTDTDNDDSTNTAS